MNVTALPTLQKIVLLKLAARVCYTQRFTEEFEDRMLDNTSLFFYLPKRLFRNLRSLIRPVLMEICSWISYIRHIHSEIINVYDTACSCLTEIDLEENLLWQTVGLINKEQTSLSLIRDERLDIAFRFVLACNCCSETNILRLWEMLSHDRQLRFLTRRFPFLPVVNYWTMRLATAGSLNYKIIPNPPFPYVFDFEYSDMYLDAMYSYYDRLPANVRYHVFGTYGTELDDLKRLISAAKRTAEYRDRVTVGLVNVDNVAALKYFLGKFERIKRQKLLEVVARNHFISNELLVFCISQMSNDQFVELFRGRRRSRVLSCLLNSPWQESFWDFIDRFRNDLTTREYVELCKYILGFKIRGNWSDNDYYAVHRELRRRFREMRARARN